MDSEKALELTDSDFEQQVIDSDLPVLVDFWAEWCMPCKMLEPTIEELAGEYAGRAKVARMDTDSAKATAMRFGISAIPTLILFNKGEVTKKFVGLQQKADLAAALDELLVGSDT
jgi:thioredoxin 1